MLRNVSESAGDGTVAAQMEEAQDNLAMCQRMDDWPTLSVAAHEKVVSLAKRARVAPAFDACCRA